MDLPGAPKNAYAFIWWGAQLRGNFERLWKSGKTLQEKDVCTENSIFLWHSYRCFVVKEVIIISFFSNNMYYIWFSYHPGWQTFFCWFLNKSNVIFIPWQCPRFWAFFVLKLWATIWREVKRSNATFWVWACYYSCVCSRWLLTFYHGKSPLSHHLGSIFFFYNHLKQIQV